MARAHSSSRSGELRSVYDGDAGTLERVRGGDDGAFAELVERWSGVMLRLALVHVDSRAVAEEVDATPAAGTTNSA